MKILSTSLLVASVMLLLCSLTTPGISLRGYSASFFLDDTSSTAGADLSIIKSLGKEEQVGYGVHGNDCYKEETVMMREEDHLGSIGRGGSSGSGGLENPFTFDGENRIKEVVVTRPAPYNPPPSPFKPSGCGIGGSVGIGGIGGGVGGGTGGGGIGGVSATPPDSTLKEKPDKDPCAGRKAVNERLQNDRVKALNNSVHNKTQNSPVNGSKVEHGYETVLTDLSSKTMKHNPIKSGTSNSLPVSTRWNAKEGYTIAYTHGHPSNSAPSPSDLFVGTSYYNQVPAGERSVFAGYFTSTILTNDYIYVVTVKDEAKWAAVDLSTKINRDAANTAYRKKAREFFTTTERESVVEAAEYALLSLYGEAINIYRAPNDGSLNFQPLKLQLNMAIVDPCR